MPKKIIAKEEVIDKEEAARLKEEVKTLCFAYWSGMANFVALSSISRLYDLYVYFAYPIIEEMIDHPIVGNDEVSAQRVLDLVVTSCVALQSADCKKHWQNLLNFLRQAQVLADMNRFHHNFWAKKPIETFLLFLSKNCVQRQFVNISMPNHVQYILQKDELILAEKLCLEKYKQDLENQYQNERNILRAVFSACMILIASGCLGTFSFENAVIFLQYSSCFFPVMIDHLFDDMRDGYKRFFTKSEQQKREEKQRLFDEKITNQKQLLEPIAEEFKQSPWKAISIDDETPNFTLVLNEACLDGVTYTARQITRSLTFALVKHQIPYCQIGRKTLDISLAAKLDPTLIASVIMDAKQHLVDSLKREKFEEQLKTIFYVLNISKESQYDEKNNEYVIFLNSQKAKQNVVRLRELFAGRLGKVTDGVMHIKNFEPLQDAMMANFLNNFKKSTVSHFHYGQTDKSHAIPKGKGVACKDEKKPAPSLWDNDDNDVVINLNQFGVFSTRDVSEQKGRLVALQDHQWKGFKRFAYLDDEKISIPGEQSKIAYAAFYKGLGRKNGIVKADKDLKLRLSGVDLRLFADHKDRVEVGPYIVYPVRYSADH